MIRERRPRARRRARERGVRRERRNLVCRGVSTSASFAKIVVMSVTEGEDKPLKYPHIFRAAELLVLTKIESPPLVKLD